MRVVSSKIAIFTAQCTLVQSAVLRSHVIRPSVTLVDCEFSICDNIMLEILETNCTDN